MGVKIILKMSV